MKNKVLIRLYVPEIDFSFDVFIPVNEIIWKVKKLLVKSVSDLTGGILDLESNFTLINKVTSEIYDNNSIVINPRITPVVDLDEASRSIAMLNSSLGRRPTLSVQSRIESIGSSFSQNGTKVASIFAQTDNSDVVDAIDGLGDRLAGHSGPTINAPMTVIRRDEDAYVATAIFSRNLMRAAGGVK